jgi:hypothetical protein
MTRTGAPRSRNPPAGSSFIDGAAMRCRINPTLLGMPSTETDRYPAGLCIGARQRGMIVMVRTVVGRVFVATILSALGVAGLIGGCGGDKKNPSDPEDTQGPVVISVVPVEGSTGISTSLTTVQAVFNESLNPASVDESSFFVRSGEGDTLQAIVSYNDADKKAVLTLQTILQPNASYAATVSSSVRDVAGNEMGSRKVWSFTTAPLVDGIPPSVVSTLPASDATGISLNATASAVFSEALDPSTVNGDTFTLKQGASTIAADVTYDNATFQCLLTPSSVLSYGTTYTARLATAISDTTGNSMTTAHEWSFTTVPAPTGSIQGEVRDAIFGAPGPLPNVTVTAVRSGRSAQTDAEGHFELTSVPAGPETLSVDPGLRSCYQVVRAGLVVSANETATQNFDVGVLTNMEVGEPNDILSQAEDLSAGDPVLRYLRLVSPAPQGSDTDWYKVQVTGPGKIEFIVSELPVSCQFSLYSGLDESASWTTLDGDGSGATATKAVSSEDIGYWKVRIQPASGAALGIYDKLPYRIQLRFVPITYGSVTGYVYDDLERDTARLRQIEVTVDGTALSATTDTTGSFQIDGVPTGVRTLRVDRGLASCYQVATVPVFVEAGESAAASIPLSVNPVMDPGEPNEDWDHPYELTSRATVEANIRFVDAFSGCTGWNSLRDEDTYSINVTGAGTLTVTVTNLPVTCCFQLVTPDSYYASWTSGGSNGTSTVATRSIACSETGIWKIRIVPASGLEGTYDLSFYTITAVTDIITTGSVTGYVYDALQGNDSVLQGVVVTVDGTDLSATTDAEGNYQIDGVPACGATLRVDRGISSCYLVATQPVVVPAGGSVTANIPMSYNSLRDIGEPNDDWDQPYALTSGTAITAYIRFVHAFGACGATNSGRDEDNYSIDMTGAGTLRLEVSNLPVACCFALVKPDGYYGSWTTGGTDGTSTVATRIVAVGEIGLWKVRLAPMSGALGVFDTSPYTIELTKE